MNIVGREVQAREIAAQEKDQVRFIIFRLLSNFVLPAFSLA